MNPEEACKEQSDIVDIQMRDMLLHPQFYAHLPERWQTMFEAIAPIINKNTVLLDVGCRTGEFLEQIKFAYEKENKPVCDLHGIDVSAKAIKLATKERGLKKCIVGDMHYTGYENDTFDIITASHVLEHSYDADQFFKEMLRILNPDGKLFILIPIEGKPANYQKPIPDGHKIYFPNPFDIKNIVKGYFNTVVLFNLMLSEPNKDGKVMVREALFVMRP